jgi:hypothetical protein
VIIGKSPFGGLVGLLDVAGRHGPDAGGGYREWEGREGREGFPRWPFFCFVFAR